MHYDKLWKKMPACSLVFGVMTKDEKKVVSTKIFAAYQNDDDGKKPTTASSECRYYDSSMEYIPWHFNKHGSSN